MPPGCIISCALYEQMADTTETSQFESDQFLKLLTDALQAGPGSPQWHEAVVRLRTSNAPEADEYRLLVEARENLESGRDYRSIRAGPGFTRKVMDGIAQEQVNPTAAPPTANILAIVALLVVLTIIIVVAALLYKSSPPPGTITDLQNTTFLQTILSSEFSQTIGPEWKKFGLEPIISVKEKALRGGVQKDDREDYRGGGIYTATPIPADQPFAIEATIRMPRSME